MDEDEEDTYGFGSFSDLFDAGPVPAPKRLDLGALSHYCMSERKLVHFRQVQQDRHCVGFQHVAAKFNGVSIDGGLGVLSVVPLEKGGGFVWLQTTQSDSDASRRRKKELQDITNRQPNGGGHTAADALCVPKKLVTCVQPTTLQNRAQGVEIKVIGGNWLEFTFMPGPFAKSTHRDEFLQTLEQQIRGSKRTEKRMEEHVDEPKDVNVNRKTQVETKTTQKEMFRQLVREYTELDPMSEEAFTIAKELHAKTGYCVGPMTAQVPKFSEDLEFRKRSMEELAAYLNRMKQEGKDADAHREIHTKVKHCRMKNNLFEYTDIDTGEKITPQTYEQRYMEYVKSHEANFVIHGLPNEYKVEKDCKVKETGDVLAAETEGARSVFLATLGIDISTSRVIDRDFFSRDVDCVPSSAQTCKSDEAPFRDAVERARIDLWTSWGVAFAQVSDMCPSVESRTRSKNSFSDQVTMRKRPRRRRRSLVVPKFDDLHANIEDIVADSSQNEASSGATYSKSRSHQSRDTLYKQDTIKKARRTSLAQRMVSIVEYTPTVEKASAAQEKTPRPLLESTHTMHRTRGYSCETSSLEMVGDDDSSLCQLCYSEEALVHMKPCDHTVCSSCWSRLSPSSDKTGTGSRRLCPWDREVVTKR